MSPKTIFILISFLWLLPAYSQSNKLQNLHQTQHKELLANSRSQIDKSVIEEYFRIEIEGRENSSERSPEIEKMVSDLLDEAKSHLGKGYRSGGKGPNVFDCSGFAGYVYRQFGFQLGASSSDQYTQGTNVDITDLKPGDLVFFKGRNNNSNRIGHVGIVVSADPETGKFRFIHASTSGGIKYDTNEGYYGIRYVGAKRIIDENSL